MMFSIGITDIRSSQGGIGMENKNDKAIFDSMTFEDEDFDLDALEEKLQSELDGQFSELALLEEERELIGNPDSLGETVMNVVWEQFINQVAVTAGEDFIKENHGLHLDLRNEAHIQTAGDFAKGNIAEHNYISKEQVEQNYDRYKNTPHTDFRDNYVDPGMDATLKRAGELKKEGIDTVKDIYTGRQISTNTKLENGKNNPKAAQREHVKPSAELYKNPSLQMANNSEELACIVNNPENLQGYTTAERNNRKSDKSANEMSEYDKNKHWERADNKAEKYIKQKEKEGEDRLYKEGRKTQREEAFRIGGKVLRTAMMTFLAGLVKEIMGKLVLWLRAAEKSIHTLIQYIKDAVCSFISKLKDVVVNAGSAVLTAIATAIIGPVVNVIKKTMTLLKQGWKSLKEAVLYLRDPANKGKSLKYLLPEVGKIVIAGMSGVGAIVLGEVIESALMPIPFLAVEIPALGSLASIIGLLMGAIICGVIGAIAINLIDKYVAQQQKTDNSNRQIDKQNDILQNQDKLKTVKRKKFKRTKGTAFNNIINRHQAGVKEFRISYDNIFSGEYTNSQERNRENSNALDKLLEM